MSSITLSAVLAIVIIAISYLVMRVFSLEHRVHAVEQMRQLEEMNKVYGECGTEDALCTLPVHLMGFGDVILPEPEPPAPLKREETGINIEEDAIREEPTAEDMISEEPAAGPSPGSLAARKMYPWASMATRTVGHRRNAWRSSSSSSVSMPKSAATWGQRAMLLRTPWLASTSRSSRK